jgi:hypothetical protein
MINIFKGLYWLMAILSLLASFGLWIFMMVNRDDSVAVCSDFLQHPGSYGETFTGGIAFTKTEADDFCSTRMRNFLIGSGVAVFLGNFIQVNQSTVGEKSEGA